MLLTSTPGPALPGESLSQDSFHVERSCEKQKTYFCFLEHCWGLLCLVKQDSPVLGFRSTQGTSTSDYCPSRFRIWFLDVLNQRPVQCTDLSPVKTSHLSTAHWVSRWFVLGSSVTDPTTNQSETLRSVATHLLFWLSDGHRRGSASSAVSEGIGIQRNCDVFRGDWDVFQAHLLWLNRWIPSSVFGSRFSDSRTLTEAQLSLLS